MTEFSETCRRSSRWADGESADDRVAASQRGQRPPGCVLDALSSRSAIGGCEGALICGACTVPCGTLALFGGVSDGLRAGQPAARASDVLASATASHRQTTSRGDLVSCGGREIARMGDVVTRCGRIETRLPGRVELIGTAARDAARRLVSTQIQGRHQIAITSDRIARGRSSAAVGSRLVAVGGRPVRVEARLTRIRVRVGAASGRQLGVVAE